MLFTIKEEERSKDRLPKSLLSLVGAAGLVAHQLKDRGFVFLVRYSPTNNQLQFHMDWDCGEYQGVMNHAQLVKEDRKRSNQKILEVIDLEIEEF